MFVDHSLYELLFSNGQTEYLTANMIDENILSQVDPDGYHHQVLKDISDHSADGSVLKRSDEFIRSRRGNLHANNKTRSLKLEVEWKYGTLI